MRLDPDAPDIVVVPVGPPAHPAVVAEGILDAGLAQAVTCDGVDRLCIADRIAEVPHRLAQLLDEPAPTSQDLLPTPLGGGLREHRMVHRVPADDHSRRPHLAELVPGHPEAMAKLHPASSGPRGL